MKDNRRIIAIAGAGIAGLTAALTLAKAGFVVKVFEKSSVPATSGTGIQLSPNAVKVLFDLGLSKQLNKVGFAPKCIEIGYGLTGKNLTSFVLGDDIQKRHAAPYLVLHRSDLANVLEAACHAHPGITLERDHQITDLKLADNSVEIDVNGENISVDAAIGADGTWSTLRSHVPDAVSPQFTGRVAWRIVVNASDIPSSLSRDSTGLWLGPDVHLVHYPLRNGEIFNVIAITPWNGSQQPDHGWLKSPDQKSRTAAFSRWHRPLQDLVGLESDWGGWPIYSIPKIGGFSNGALCLIGDAAHTMVPYGAQGGSAAIEDAAVLAHCCGNTPQNLQAAFKEFESVRSSRIQSVLNLSNNNRRIYHMEWPLSLARNLAMRIAPQEVMQKRMDWLYGWKHSSPV